MEMTSDLHILVIEDNIGDVRLIKEAFKESRSNPTLFFVKDGEMALEFIYKKGDYHNAMTPDVIILDLNLPKIDGRQVLKIIKEDIDLKRIPVIVFTSSSAREDVIKSYDLHANCYINKQLDFDDFVYAIRQMDKFWCSTVKLPQLGNEW